MNEKMYTILTKTGIAKHANATISGEKIDYEYFAIGDGNGEYPNLDENQKELVNEVWRTKVRHVELVKSETGDDTNQIRITALIPPKTGGFVIREVGVFDKDGDLIAVGRYPLTWKPSITDGAVSELTMRMVIQLSSSKSVELKIDPTIINATLRDLEDLRITFNKSLDKKASIDSVPKKNSQLENDSKFITESDIPKSSLITRKNLNEAESQIKELKFVEVGIERVQPVAKDSDIYFQTSSPIVDSFIEPKIGSVKTSEADGIEQIFRKYENGDNKNIYPITKSKAVAMDDGRNLEETLIAGKEELDKLFSNKITNGVLNFKNPRWTFFENTKLIDETTIEFDIDTLSQPSLNPQNIATFNSSGAGNSWVAGQLFFGSIELKDLEGQFEKVTVQGGWGVIDTVEIKNNNDKIYYFLGKLPAGNPATNFNIKGKGKGKMCNPVIFSVDYNLLEYKGYIEKIGKHIFSCFFDGKYFETKKLMLNLENMLKILSVTTENNTNSRNMILDIGGD